MQLCQQLSSTDRPIDVLVTSTDRLPDVLVTPTNLQWACMQVTFVSKSIASGRADIDAVTDISFASILSREQTGSSSDDTLQVFLVSVMQFKVSLHAAIQL
jgi:hypothetical protein